MPAPKKRYYDCKDIQEILDIGKTKANEIMNDLDSRGLVLKIGGIRKVRITWFDEYLEEHEGAEYRYKQQLAELAALGSKEQMKCQNAM